MQDMLNQMRDRVLRHADPMRRETAIPRLGIGVLRQHSVPATTMCGPGICLVLQGAKQMLVGTKLLRYSAGSCFASLIELPTTRIVFETEGRKPYVATSLTIDPALCLAVLSDLPAAPSNKTVPAYNVTTVSRELLAAWDHHLALLDMPNDIPALAAPRERELVYRLLQSSHGPLLRQIARDEGKLAQVRRSIDWMRHHFAQPLPMKELAEIAGMSVPSFNRHFRAATSTSPLQYQKTLRLQAARRLLATDADAAHAAYAVGYESASQFSREYSRLFGQPPKQHASQLRANIGEISNIMI
ncbi:AraC family transcriptional regulator [Labrys monachus]|uniref:AraC-like DNA-binding protein n=1 Tax=Labrys monachus TaxID=217067 RepID=A0ABU0FGM7_9HYPH|nr:AraC family transcriptional regulator [Labrys monachus]MDQ0393773.1 AraC-like DNA-binding protein [Labrys monachus]